MEYTEMRTKIASLRREVDAILLDPDLEPCWKAGLESVKAHTDLLCMELMLDID